MQDDDPNEPLSVMHYRQITKRQIKIEEKLDSLLGMEARIKSDFVSILDNHESRMHREYNPDHHEQHSRLSAWFRRIDSSTDNMFNYIGVFFVILLGWGAVSFFNAQRNSMNYTAPPATTTPAPPRYQQNQQWHPIPPRGDLNGLQRTQ